jgi:hypothetical protein
MNRKIVRLATLFLCELVVSYLAFTGHYLLLICHALERKPTIMLLLQSHLFLIPPHKL